MKNIHRGFVAPLLLIIIAFLVIGGGAYYAQTLEVPAIQTQTIATTTAETMSITAGKPLNSTSTTTPIERQKTTQTKKVSEGITMSPAEGPVGTIVTLEGNLAAKTTVRFGKETIGQVPADTHSFTFVVPVSFTTNDFGAPPDIVRHGEYTVTITSDAVANTNVETMFTVTPKPSAIKVGPTPKVTSISSEQITGGTKTELTLYGSGLSTTTMVAIVGAGSITSVGPNRVSADGTQLVFTFPDTIMVPALYSVVAYYRGGTQGYVVGGQSLTSSSVTVKLLNPYASVITSITPESAPIGATVTIHGSNFYGDTKIQVGTYLPSVGVFDPIVPSLYTSTSLSFVVPPGMSAAKYVISVSGKAGHISNSVIFTVR